MDIFQSIWRLARIALVWGGLIIVAAVMFPNGELGVAVREIFEGFIALFSAIGDAIRQVA